MKEFEGPLPAIKTVTGPKGIQAFFVDEEGKETPISVAEIPKLSAAIRNNALIILNPGNQA